MSIQALLPEIVAPILREAAGLKPNDVVGWKRALPLLAVCRSWRQLALPIVYDHIYVNSPPESKPGKQPASGPVSVPIGGSLALAATAGVAEHVSGIHVKITGESSALAFIGAMLDIMSAASVTWNKVHYLYLDVRAMVDDDVEGMVVDTAFTDQVSGTIDRLCSVLPSITKVEFHELGNRQGMYICGRVTDAYAMQLTHVTSYEPLIQSAPSFSPELVHLEISFGYRNVPWIPHVAAASLRFLFLDNAPNNFSWLPFKESKGSTDVVFSSLEQMVIYHGHDISSSDTDGGSEHIAEYSAKEHSGCRLHFPKLRSMNIHGAPHNCLMLLNGVFPAHMHSVAINSKAAFNRARQCSGLGTVVNLSLLEDHGAIANLPSDDFSDIPFLRGLKVQNQLRLSLVNYTARMLVSGVDWSSIREFQMSSAIDIDILVEILKEALQLRKASLSHVAVGEESAYCNDPLPTIDGEVAPLLSGIKTITIGDMSGNDSDCLRAIQRLMIQLRSLEKLYQRAVDNDLLLKFINAYCARFPHLSESMLGSRLGARRR